jgi:hypothetical protein
MPLHVVVPRQVGLPGHVDSEKHVIEWKHETVPEQVPVPGHVA